jgi:methyl-accepting chemotaxis protein
MSKFGKDVKDSVSSGQKLANETTMAMDAINEEVSSISEAITVIDQIAFQTNILSLNAAVEAATAGEAGKGFAVVAQEVRNLANRSADAAKEIKDLVEKATVKANDGKAISDKMKEGYDELNNHISSTIDLINHVADVSKEQYNTIVTINDNVEDIENNIPKSAKMAEDALNIAVDTKNLATAILEEANQKKFN